MLKVLIIDIETTGLNYNNDLIVEIGIAELDLNTGEIREAFNSLIKESRFNSSYFNSWIFRENHINPEDIQNAPLLSEVFEEIQSILQQYKVSGFRKEFDINFLKNRGFLIEKEFPCIMRVSARLMQVPSSLDEYKWPSMQDAYNHFFPTREYIETHRAFDDAYHEAELLYEIYRTGNFVEMEFSRELAEVYEINASLPYNRENIITGFEHAPNNPDAAIHYLKTKFPLHYPKSRKMFREFKCLPLGCGDINIIDFGCGPFTFTFSLLDEILEKSNFYGGGAFKINIIGIDKSFDSLTLGLKMLNTYKEKIKHRNFSIDVKIKYDDGDFDDISLHLKTWLEAYPADYAFLGYSLSTSSGIRNIRDIINLFYENVNSSKFFGFIIEPDYGTFIESLDLEQLYHHFPILKFNTHVIDTSCKKPNGMETQYIAIYSIFKSILMQYNDKCLNKILDQSLIKKFFPNFLLLYNKTKRWILQERLTDYVGLNLLEKNLKLTQYLFIRFLPYLKKKIFLGYKIQKGVSPDKYRDFVLINFPYILLSFMIIKIFGGELDNQLTDNIYCSRICKRNRLDRSYQFFTIGYSKFVNFELNPRYRNYLLCNADITKYFDSINRNNLKDSIEDVLRSIGVSNLLIPISFSCLGDQEGVPIGSPLSPLIANLFLRNFDARIEFHKNVIAYARYMDDLKLIVNINNDEESTNRLMSDINRNLQIFGLNLNFDKFYVAPINHKDLLYKFNRVFRRLTRLYFDIINPIKNGIGVLLYHMRINNITINNNYQRIAKLISKAFDLNNITFGFDGLRRYLILVDKKLYDDDFLEEIRLVYESNNLPFNINVNLLSFNETELSNYFIDKNRNWLILCFKFSKLMFLKLKEELRKWEGVLNQLSLLDNQISIEERKNIVEFRDQTLDSKEFLLSMRMIKYLVYRLTRLKYYKLYSQSNFCIRKLIEMIQLYFPIKLIGLVLYRYNHINLLKGLLEKGMERIEEGNDTVSRKIYPNDISYILHLLGLYYEENIDDFNDDFQFWLNKINLILLARPYEEKLAITELILRLKIINKFSFDYWKLWFQQSDNLLVLKNILICIAYHNEAPKEIPESFKRKILDNYTYDECLTNISMNLWQKIRNAQNSEDINIFKGEDIFQKIKNFPSEIDLDYELRSIFDWEDGFGGNFYY